MPLNPPQDYRKTEFTHRIGLAVDRPAAADVLPGTLYFSTNTFVLERSDGTVWVLYSLTGGSIAGVMGPPGLDGIDGEDGTVWAVYGSSPTDIAKSTYKAGGVHLSTNSTYISGTGTAGVDNTAMTVKSVTLPANTLTQVGDRIRVRTYWMGTTGAAITESLLLGPAGSEVLIGNTTDGGAASLFMGETWLHYIDNTHANIVEHEAGGLGAVSAPNVAGFTWNAEQNIIVTQDAIVNNHIVVIAVIVDVKPKGV